MTEAQRDYIGATLYNLSFTDALLGGVERIFAVAAHVGLTIIVFRGFSKGKPLVYLLVAAFATASVMYIIWAKRNTSWAEEVEEE